MNINRHITVITLASIAVLSLLALAASPAAASPVVICHDGTEIAQDTTFSLRACFLSQHGINSTFATTVDVENIGNTTGTVTLKLYVEDDAVDNRTITLAPNTSREVKLRTNFSTTGSYNVSVNSLRNVRISVINDSYCRPLDSFLTYPSTCPQDLNGDGLYEDIDADGDLDFNDVIELAFTNFSELEEQTTQYFDFDGDGDMDFDDVIELAFMF